MAFRNICSALMVQVLGNKYQSKLLEVIDARSASFIPLELVVVMNIYNTGRLTCSLDPSAQRIA